MLMLAGDLDQVPCQLAEESLIHVAVANVALSTWGLAMGCESIESRKSVKAVWTSVYLSKGMDWRLKVLNEGSLVRECLPYEGELELANEALPNCSYEDRCHSLHHLLASITRTLVLLCESIPIAFRVEVRAIRMVRVSMIGTSTLYSGLLVSAKTVKLLLCGSLGWGSIWE